MPTVSRRPLKPNPFISLRDPKTGKWRVILKRALQQSLQKVPTEQRIEWAIVPQMYWSAVYFIRFASAAQTIYRSDLLSQ